MSNSTTPLHGTGALVTGSSRGVGAAIACEPASQRATIALTYSPNEAKANLVVAGIVKAGGTALASKADQANEERVIELVLTPFERLGQLDIQVNNAGVVDAGTVDETVDTSPIKRQLCINYQGVVASIRVASRAMNEEGRNITHWSRVALRSSWTDSANYSATKLTIKSCTKGAARELGPKGILVNATGAGFINTDKNLSDGPLAENQKAATALDRYCRPEEIAVVVTFIANPAVSYATGAINAIDGGFGAWGKVYPEFPAGHKKYLLAHAKTSEALKVSVIVLRRFATKSATSRTRLSSVLG